MLLMIADAVDDVLDIYKYLMKKSNEPSFYPYNILVNKCSGSCNNINDLYAKLCIPDVVKNMNIKVFNLS